MELIVIALIEALLKYGPVAFIAMMKNLDTDNPSAADIRALMVKPPEDYLGTGSGS